MHAKSKLQTTSRWEGLGIRKDELANCLTAVSYQRLMTSHNQTKCLMDIASGKVLKDAIEQEFRGEFIDWEKNMSLLQKGGMISDEVYWEFRQG